MNTFVYRCPCCGSSLTFDGVSGKLKCASCGNSYDAEALDLVGSDQDASSVQFDLPKATFGDEDASAMQAFTCKNCGAEQYLRMKLQLICQ